MAILRKVEAQLCPQCSAPLKIGPTDTDVKCQYCGNSIRIERAKPPPVQMPSAHTVYVDPAAGRAVSRIIWLSVAIPMLVPLAVTFGPWIARRLKSAGGVSFPVTCALNDELEISDVTFRGTGTLINAELNCKLTIKNSRLTGDVVVKSGGSATITIEGSTLEGTHTALELGINDHVRASKNSALKSADAAIEGGLNLDLTLEDTKIEGGPAAVRGSLNTQVTATRAEIVGRDAAFEVGNNGKLKLSQVTARAATAVTAGFNLELSADRSTLRGETKGAIHGENNTKVKLRNKTSVFAKRVGVEGTNALEIGIDDSTIEAGETAIRGRSNAKVALSKQARVKGATIAISVDDNLDLTADESTVESAGTAVQTDGAARIDVEGSTIRGGVNAFAMKRAPALFSVKNTTVAGAQILPRGK
jgi:hypothetical protein